MSSADQNKANVSIVCGLTTPPDPPQHTGARRHRSAVGIAICMFAQGRPERRRLPRGRRTTLPSSATTFNGVSPVRRGSFDLRQRSAAGSIEPDRVSGPLTDIDDGASREARDDETWPGRLRNNVTRGATDHASPSRLVDEIPDFYQAAIDAKPNPPVRVGRDLLFNDGAAVEPYDERLAATVHDEALRSSKADVLGELFSIQSERQQTRCRTRWVSSTQWNHVAAGTIRGHLSTHDEIGIKTALVPWVIGAGSRRESSRIETQIEILRPRFLRPDPSRIRRHSHGRSIDRYARRNAARVFDYPAVNAAVDEQLAFDAWLLREERHTNDRNDHHEREHNGRFDRNRPALHLRVSVCM